MSFRPRGEEGGLGEDRPGGGGVANEDKGWYNEVGVETIFNEDVYYCSDAFMCY